MNNNVDVRVYPIDEPKGTTQAFASVSIDDMAAIRGIRVVSGEKGLFVAMPQSKDNAGEYHDIAFPLTAELRKEITDSVLAEYETQMGIDPELRGYENGENVPSGRNGENTGIDVKVFPIDKPKGDTLAFASVGLDDAVAIRGIRVVKSEKGNFISMPQSKDKEGNYRDIAFPLSGDLRKAISSEILGEFDKLTAERSEKKQGFGERLAEGKAQVAQYVASAAPAMAAAAKKSPGLGD